MKNVLLFVLLLNNLYSHAGNEKTLLFVGSYTDGKPDTGIYVFEFNDKTGELQQKCIVDKVVNPSFLDFAPNGKQLYVCTDTKLPQKGSVSAYAIDSVNGTLTFLNKQPSGGENPIYVAVDNSSGYVACGNYGSGSAVIFKVNEQGGLHPYDQLIQFSGSSINKQRQEKSHIHATVFSPDNKFLLLPDLGADKIRAFNFKSNSKPPLTAAHYLLVNTAQGSGPRHLIFHPNKKFVYCIEELSGTITTYNYQKGTMTVVDRVFACADTADIYSSADLHITPDGRFLYATNRGENTIAIFSINKKDGKLTLTGHESTYGNSPRNFTIDPSGNFLLVANQLSNNIVVFRINKETGKLIKTAIEIKVFNPSCLKIRTYLN
jgi:6-phosphogluconolactonase (cycloisomerase 2 family)